MSKKDLDKKEVQKLVLELRLTYNELIESCHCSKFKYMNSPKSLADEWFFCTQADLIDEVRMDVITASAQNQLLISKLFNTACRLADFAGVDWNKLNKREE